MLHEEKECSVCFLPYSRQERVPRVLHCEHTFCTPCLNLMAQLSDDHFTIRCPLCRQMTWVNPERGLLGTLWVDGDRWEQISEEEDEEEEQEEEDAKQEIPARQKKEIRFMLQEEWSSSKQSRSKVRLPAFLKRLHFMKHQQPKTAVPSCNVEGKSWRRLTAEEMI